MPRLRVETEVVQEEYGESFHVSITCTNNLIHRKVKKFMMDNLPKGKVVEMQWQPASGNHVFKVVFRSESEAKSFQHDLAILEQIYHGNVPGRLETGRVEPLYSFQHHPHFSCKAASVSKTDPDYITPIENMKQTIKGYRQLDESELAIINKLKDLQSQVLHDIQSLEQHNSTDKRWVQAGKLDIQKGFMCLTRSIARPIDG